MLLFFDLISAYVFFLVRAYEISFLNKLIYSEQESYFKPYKIFCPRFYFVKKKVILKDGV